MDAPIEIRAGNEVWRPENYGGKFYGPATLRTGIEKSRNVMTVRLAQDMGMPLVAEYAKRFGIYDDLAALSADGARRRRDDGAAHGRPPMRRSPTAAARSTPTLIDRIQDRYGRTIYQHDQRHCEGCDATELDRPGRADARRQSRAGARPDDRLPDHLDDGGRGAARHRRPSCMQVGKPIAGKTGTTNDEKDAWFVGFSPDLVVGVFIGYDKPRPMGKGQTGGVLAAPIFTEFMKVALEDAPPKEFQVPPGHRADPDRPAHGPARARRRRRRRSSRPSSRAPRRPTTYSIIGYQDIDGHAGRRVSPEADRAVPREPAGSTERALSDTLMGAAAGSAPFLDLEHRAMRAETQALVDEIRSAVALIRRHL